MAQNEMAEIIFVLVRPAVPENIGAAARALKTMGFQQLRIVDSDKHLEKPARILAHASNDILENAQTFPNLTSALADIDFSIGTSAKARHERRYQLAPAEVRAAIENKQQIVCKAAIVFGCEESGLSNEELAQCDALSSIPLAVEYPSLNLSQAVMLYAYELANLQFEQPLAADAGELHVLKMRIEKLFAQLGIEPDSKLARWADERAAQLTQDDVRFLHQLLMSIEKKI